MYDLNKNILYVYITKFLCYDNAPCQLVWWCITW